MVVMVKMGVLNKGSVCSGCDRDMSGQSGVRLGETDFCWNCVREEDISRYVKNSGVEVKQKTKQAVVIPERKSRLEYRNYGKGRFDVLAKVTIPSGTIESIYKCKCGNILMEKVEKGVDKGRHRCIGCEKIL